MFPDFQTRRPFHDLLHEPGTYQDNLVSSNFTTTKELAEAADNIWQGFQRSAVIAAVSQGSRQASPSRHCSPDWSNGEKQQQRLGCSPMTVNKPSGGSSSS